MVRSLVMTFLFALAVALCVPLSAQARVPCAAEQLIPTAANAAQVSDAIFCLTNQVRSNYGLPALRRDGRLDIAARLHSADMALRNYFSHVTLEGLTPGDRATAQGYGSGVGENIASGHRDARTVVVGWMASAGHCRNILSGALDMGVGTALSNAPYYTQVLGNYFTQTVDQAPRNGCPYTVDVDALNVTEQTVAAATNTAPAATTVTPAPDAEPDTAAATGSAGPFRPALSALGLSPSRFRAGRGTAISYTLSADATVTFRVQRCSVRRGNGCIRYRTLAGTLTDAGSAGPNTLRFSGRIGSRKLKPGRYRLDATAVDQDGNVSVVRRAAFVLVRR